MLLWVMNLGFAGGGVVVTAFRDHVPGKWSRSWNASVAWLLGALLGSGWKGGI